MMAEAFAESHHVMNRKKDLIGMSMGLFCVFLN